MTTRHYFSDLGFKALNKMHRTIVHASRGRIGASAFGMPAVELFTVGRKSGHTHSTMLTAPVVDGDTVILVASKGGDDRDPDWYKNIVVQPDVEVIIAGKRTLMRARSASADEKAELWPRIIASYHPYGNYRRRTERDIPIVICEPR
jgi:deazaflavin-dependent oxidoreductase (nitroreductase family)